MRTVFVQGNSVKNCCAYARRLLGIKLEDSRVHIVNEGEDNVYRVSLLNGDVVECLIVQHAVCEGSIEL